MFGEKGVLNHVDGKVQCHVCGKTYHGLFMHIRKAHGMDIEDYKEEFGLNKTQSLVSDNLHKKLSISNDHIRQFSGQFPQTKETLRKDFHYREQAKKVLRARVADTVQRPDIFAKAQIAALSPKSLAKKSDSLKRSWRKRKEK